MPDPDHPGFGYFEFQLQNPLGFARQCNYTITAPEGHVIIFHGLFLGGNFHFDQEEFYHLSMMKDMDMTKLMALGMDYLYEYFDEDSWYDYGGSGSDYGLDDVFAHLYPHFESPEMMKFMCMLAPERVSIIDGEEGLIKQ